MRILITGITSIHGWPLFTHLRDRFGHSAVFGIRSPKMELPHGENIVSCCVTDAAVLQKICTHFNPTHLIHAAGVCDLDVCEERPHWAHTLNTQSAEIIASIFGTNSHIFHLSTDLVFSGNNPPPKGYAETDPIDPISVAGKTFARGEEAILKCPNACIVRLGLPLAESLTGDKGALDWIGSRFRKNLPVTLFTDEYRSAIRSHEINEFISALLINNAKGIYHCGGIQPLSLFEIGTMILTSGNFPSHLLKGITTAQEINGPPRVGNIALNSEKIRGFVAEKILDQGHAKA